MADHGDLTAEDAAAVEGTATKPAEEPALDLSHLDLTTPGIIRQPESAKSKSGLTDRVRPATRMTRDPA